MKSALRPAPFRAGGALPASLILHAAVACGILAFGARSPGPSRLINPDEVMQVALVSLPLQTTPLAQKEMHRAPVTEGSTETPSLPPPPVVSDMAMEVEDAPEPQGVETERPSDNQSERDRLMRELRREQALASLDSPEGPVDQARTDIDGTEGGSGSATGNLGDPRLAAYQEQVKNAVMAHFSALQTDPLQAVIHVVIDRRGNILNSQLIERSGDPSFDAAARLAIRSTQRVPAPPADLMPEGKPTAPFQIRFSNVD